MSNFFSDALNNADQLEQELLGPDYEYYKFVKTPAQIGMSSKAKDLVTNFKGMAGYVDVLLFGGGKAQDGSQPLGDKFFLTTGAKCKDVASGETVTRSLYINNQPDGSIPFLSSSPLGDSDTLPKGLIPGVLSNVGNINPMQIFTAFMSGATPDCQSIEMPTVDDSNTEGTGTGFVTNTDIQAMNPCWFPTKVNPVTSTKCEGFTTMNSKKLKPAPLKNMPEDDLIKMYYSALGLFGIYILFKLFEKKR